MSYWNQEDWWPISTAPEDTARRAWDAADYRKTALWLAAGQPKRSIMAKHQVLRALGMGLSVLITGMMVYKGVPTSWDAVWQPGLQASLAVLSALGINSMVRRRAP